MNDYERHKSSKPNVATVHKVDNKDAVHLRYGIGRQDFVFHSRGASRLAYNGKVPHGVSGRHSLACSRFPADDYGLVPVVSDWRSGGYIRSCEDDILIRTLSCLPGHLLVGLLCHCKYMRVHVSHVLAGVGVYDCIAIDMELFVRVYSHQYDT